MYHVEFLGHNFASGLRTLNLKKPKNLKTFFIKNLFFSSPDRYHVSLSCTTKLTMLTYLRN